MKGNLGLKPLQSSTRLSDPHDGVREMMKCRSRCVELRIIKPKIDGCIILVHVNADIALNFSFWVSTVTFVGAFYEDFIENMCTQSDIFTSGHVQSLHVNDHQKIKRSPQHPS